MIHAVGVDWGLDKRPEHGTRHVAKRTPKRWQLVRATRHDREHDILLGVVGQCPQALQGVEVFGSFGSIVGEDAEILAAAGALGDGE